VVRRRQRKPSAQFRPSQEEPNRKPQPEPEKRTKVKRENVKKEELQLSNKIKYLFEDGCASSITRSEMLDYLRANGLAIKGNRCDLADRIMLFISQCHDVIG
jgi:hypothetical protein